jgi:hypothetical protein
MCFTCFSGNVLLHYAAVLARQTRHEISCLVFKNLTLARKEEAKCRVVGLIMAIVAKLIEAGFKIRLMVAQFERRQHATVVSTVAAVVEQRDIPVSTKRVQEFQQRAG